MTLILFFLACDTFSFLSTEEDSATETTAPTPNPEADIDWNEEQLVLKIKNGDSIQLEFGIVETSDECSADTVYGCWTGESCSATSGYISPDGSSIGPYCHPVGTTGVTLEYSANLTDVMDGVTGTNVIEGGRTGFPAPTEEESYEYKVTYYLNNTNSQDCWVWGVNPEYFEEQNCTFPVPIHSIDSSSNMRFILK